MSGRLIPENRRGDEFLRGKVEALGRMKDAVGKIEEELERYDTDAFEVVVESVLKREYDRLAHAACEVDTNTQDPWETLVKKAKIEGQRLQMKRLISRKAELSKERDLLETAMGEAEQKILEMTANKQSKKE